MNCFFVPFSAWKSPKLTQIYENKKDRNEVIGQKQRIAMTDLAMIWDEVINMLDLQLNTIQLKNWIKPLRPIQLKDDVLLLDTASSFIGTMVKKNYQSSIEHCLSYICERPISIQLIDPSSNDYDQWRTLPPSDEENFIFPKKDDDLDEDFRQDLSPHRQERVLPKKKEKKENNGYSSLNPKYTMEAFVRGNSNDFAYATAKAVIANPGTTYNPLFIYGLSGLGKTHLMQAIAHEILRQDPNKKVLYITSENFMNEMIAVIENGTNAEKENFRRKYRSIDVLLIDDIQFIAGKKATMEEVFHTFNDLKEANKQIVLSADKPPKQLKNLEERLVTRFEGGMTADIQQPDFETRVAILNNKMKGESIHLPQYVVEFIAQNVTANIRELEGALLRVIAYFHFRNKTIDENDRDNNMATAREALKLERERDIEITLEDIIKAVTEYYNLEANDLTSKSRIQTIAQPRQVAMYLGRTLTNLSLVAIGRSFLRDHTTVMHAVDKIADLVKKDPEIREDVENLEDQLKHR